MIAREKAKQLAKFYQIDEFTIKREYLQLVFLSYLYQLKESSKIFFKGGTAIRLLLDSSRFSEDLDFSTTYSKKEIKKIIKKIERSMKNELADVKILPLYSGKEGERFRIKYQDKDLKYPLIIRLDFHQVKKIEETTVSPLITKFPIVIFPLICHLSFEEILKEKIKALLTRGKGKDIFDFWFLLKKGIKTKRFFDKEKLIKKIKNYSQKQLEKDLGNFLPVSQRGVLKILKEDLILLVDNKS
ncbi:MAG: nucleotidyl transferase AbiEii/AbiGii toxin family protein [Patescibacteria group bacterium]|nr:nucleotidyl transferase AbiEii/AbiGii toxin family protein [Patescibacteria group bacterium]